MRYPRRARLFWLTLLAIGVLGVWLLPPAPARARELHSVEIQFAFWGFFITLAGWIWNGLQAAGQVTLQALAWSVKALWAFATAAYDAAKAVGRAFAIAGKEIWQFLRTTLGRAVVEGWKKLWHLVDRLRAWLERSFKPILQFLFRLRDRLMRFYTHWIRPVLDIIDIGRKVLRVLGELGIAWAKALDRKLLEVQEAIDRPFRKVLAKVNELIGLVNRIVTLDGLIQRLALLRSIERDVRYITNALHNYRSTPLSTEDQSALADKNEPPTRAQLSDEFDQMLQHGDGPLAERYSGANLSDTIFERLVS